MCELQAKEQATVKKAKTSLGTKPHVAKNNGSSDLGPVQKREGL